MCEIVEPKSTNCLVFSENCLVMSLAKCEFRLNWAMLEQHDKTDCVVKQVPHLIAVVF